MTEVRSTSPGRRKCTGDFTRKSDIEVFPGFEVHASDYFVSSAVIIVAFLFNILPLNYLLFFLIVYGVIVVYGGFIYRSYLTIARDLRGLYLILTLKYDLRQRMSENRSICEIFDDIVEVQRDKLAIHDIGSRRNFTFSSLLIEANKYAFYFQSLGYRKGDVIALFMENSADFVIAWLGLARIGVVTAWINCNLRKESLAHCIRVSSSKAIICSRGQEREVNGLIEAGLLDAKRIDTYVVGPNELGYTNLIQSLEEVGGRSPACLDHVDFKSVLCLIYTSGTTGMPKAAIMKHFRYYSMAVGSSRSFGIRSDDRIYISLPLYHTAGGIIGVGQVILNGCSAVIRKKFSASNFWKDCFKHNCTVSQYIGEICRYLLAQPKCEEECSHSVRLMYGNGLRAEIWQQFVDRFHVRIGEIYGSTEGTSSLVNIDGKVGSCGFLPLSPLTKYLHPVRLIKVDGETGEVVRGEDGLCVPCSPGETGAMVSSIRKNNPLLVFEGYVSEKDTNKKVIRDVFTKGDSVFLSGDILHMDRLGYLYFKDRTGDTFRWKGENVSTTEVEGVLHLLESVSDATVYGVHVPGYEGRAGMAALVRSSEKSVDDMQFLNEVEEKLCSALPSYAIPVFVRLCNSVDKTGTFKLVKTNLRKLSYEPRGEAERVYYRDNVLRKYIRLDNDVYELIKAGNFARL
ncbi:hypothetical protein AB6A40_003493 [Gnathostoma spinigerum]|uniref:Very long-chain fatty acid transport protein n=1 Tax=Gnathostoma spinigerum TaxID=75299 RepID=A0ABD6E9P9_9BILA